MSSQPSAPIDFHRKQEHVLLGAVNPWPVPRARNAAGGKVRFCYAESMTNPAFYGPLAQAAEDAGYHSMVIPDSICYPAESDSVYPFNPDGTREFLDGKPFLE